MVLCENNVQVPQIREVMLHETIHAYDHCRAKIDDSDCAQIACTEVGCLCTSPLTNRSEPTV